MDDDSTLTRCQSLSQDVNDFPDLKTILPDDYDHLVCEYCDHEYGFKAILHLPKILSQLDVLLWKKSLESKSGTFFRYYNTYKTKGHIFKKAYKCVHNWRVDVNQESLTVCEAHITLAIKDPDFSFKRTHAPNIPCTVVMHWIHNHTISQGLTQTVVRSRNGCKSRRAIKRNLNMESRNEMKALMIEGHTHASAIEEMTNRFHQRYGEEYAKRAANGCNENGHNIPTYKQFHRMWTLEKDKMKEKTSQEGITDQLKELFEEHMGNNPGTAVMGTMSDGNAVIAVASNFMTSVCYQLEESGKIMYVRSMECSNRFGCRLLLLLTNHSSLGALPLGCIITSADDMETISSAFKLYMSLLDSSQAFYGKGFPDIIMANHPSVESNVIRQMFPKSKHFLSIYHLLRPTWELLNQKRLKDSLVVKSKLALVYSHFKEMVLSKSEQELDRNAKSFAKRFPSMAEILYEVLAKKEMWALYFRSDTNSVQEELSVFKEKVFSGTISLDLSQLFKFVVTDVEKFYAKKITQNSTASLFHEIADESFIHADRVNEDILWLRYTYGKRNYYFCKDLLLCSCWSSSNGNVCEHHAAAEREFPELKIKPPSLTSSERTNFASLLSSDNAIAMERMSNCHFVHTRHIESGIPLKKGAGNTNIYTANSGEDEKNTSNFTVEVKTETDQFLSPGLSESGDGDHSYYVMDDGDCVQATEETVTVSFDEPPPDKSITVIDISDTGTMQQHFSVSGSRGIQVEIDGKTFIVEQVDCPEKGDGKSAGTSTTRTDLSQLLRAGQQVLSEDKNFARNDVDHVSESLSQVAGVDTNTDTITNQHRVKRSGNLTSSLDLPVACEQKKRKVGQDKTTGHDSKEVLKKVGSHCDVLTGFRRVCCKVEELLKKHPGTFRSSVVDFISNFDNLSNNPNELAVALSSFGTNL